MHTYVSPGSRTQSVGLGFMAAGTLLALFGASFAWFMRGLGSEATAMRQAHNGGL